MGQETDKIYLIIADETEEFDTALRYATRSAESHNARLAVLYSIPEQEFSHWGHIEQRMRQDQRDAAENALLQIASRIQMISTLVPVFFLEEGDRIPTATRIIEDNPGICKLILGANTHSSASNPLLDYFTGKGIDKLSVPLMIVPDHISHEKIDELA